MLRPDFQFKAGPVDDYSRWPVKARWRIGLLAACTALLAHAEAPRPKPLPKPVVTPDPSDNVFSLSPHLAADVRRVAVLPLVSEGSSSERVQGCETLGPILLAELVKTGRFEVVAVTPKHLQFQTGRSGWTGAEKLPVDFFDSLQRGSGCDAVLFCELTDYHAYPPLAVGWRLKLVDVRTHQILWAVDKLFDADLPDVSKDAHRQHPTSWTALFDWNGTQDSARNDWFMDNSPRQFGQYTASKLLSTLPTRQEIVKVSWPATDDASGQTLDKAGSVNHKKTYGN